MSYEYDRITKISIICSFPVKRTDPNFLWKHMKFFYDLIDTDFGTIKMKLDNVRYCFQIWLISDKTKYEKYICGSNITIVLNCEDRIDLE